jgi:hypothetical protein
VLSEITGPYGRTRQQLYQLLERNCYLGGAIDVLHGADPKAALSKYVGQAPEYDDEEGRWLQEWIDEGCGC